MKKKQVQTTVPTVPTPIMTYEEWMAEGKKRFGSEFIDWKFVCPICGNVAALRDFKKFKDQGATPNSATQECIGRYLPKEQCHRAFGSSTKERGRPCDYALYGLFRIPGVIVKQDGKETMSFAFAEAVHEEQERSTRKKNTGAVARSV